MLSAGAAGESPSLAGIPAPATALRSTASPRFRASGGNCKSLRNRTIDADGVLEDQHVGDADIEGKLKKLVARAAELANRKTPSAGSEQSAVTPGSLP